MAAAPQPQQPPLLLLKRARRRQRHGGCWRQLAAHGYGSTLAEGVWWRHRVLLLHLCWSLLSPQPQHRQVRCHRLQPLAARARTRAAGQGERRWGEVVSRLPPSSTKSSRCACEHTTAELPSSIAARATPTSTACRHVRMPWCVKYAAPQATPQAGRRCDHVRCSSATCVRGRWP